MKYTSKTKYSKNIFVDTSAWVEFALRGEKYHREVTKYFSEETSLRNRFFTSDYVLDETFTRLLTGQNIYQAKKFKNVIERSELEKELTILFVNEQIFSKSWEIFVKYSDHKLSFTDATICAFVKDLKIDEIVTLDKGFEKAGFTIKPTID